MTDQPLSRTLSERESLLLSILSAAGESVFTIEDARAALADQEVLVHKLLRRLNRKRWSGGARCVQVARREPP